MATAPRCEGRLWFLGWAYSQARSTHCRWRSSFLRDSTRRPQRVKCSSWKLPAPVRGSGGASWVLQVCSASPPATGAPPCGLWGPRGRAGPGMNTALGTREGTVLQGGSWGHECSVATNGWELATSKAESVLASKVDSIQCHRHLQGSQREWCVSCWKWKGREDSCPPGVWTQASLYRMIMIILEEIMKTMSDLRCSLLT